MGTPLVNRDELPTGEVQIRWWCPGCRCLHRIRITPSPEQPAGSVWQYNGDECSPTFSPSVLTRCPGHPPAAIGVPRLREGGRDPVPE